MKHALANIMIRHSRSGQDRFRRTTALALLLAFSLAALAEEPPSEPRVDPDWCNCPAIVASETDALRERLMTEARERQAACRESLGVSMEQQRKGQGARLDACRCSCLEEGAEPAEGPWGDRKKPAKSGP